MKIEKVSIFTPGQYEDSKTIEKKSKMFNLKEKTGSIKDTKEFLNRIKEIKIKK